MSEIKKAPDCDMTDEQNTIPSEDLNDQVLRGLGGSPEVGTSPINRVDDATTKGQKNPVRSREEHIIELGARIFVGMRNHTDSMCEAQRYIDEAEARGAAEQRRKDGEGRKASQFYANGCYYTTLQAALRDHPRPVIIPLYTHPANVAALEGRIAELEGALRAADQFITNGVEFGFIRMPDIDTNDSAHETPRIVRDALKREGTPS